MLDHNVRPRSHTAIAAGKQVLDVVVEHADFKHVLDTALDLIETMRSLRLPSGLLLQAEPGMGKTLLLELISRRLSKAAADQSRGICLHIQLDSAVDTHRLAALVAQALGFPRLPTRQSLDSLNHMVAAGMEPAYAAEVVAITDAISEGRARFEGSDIRRGTTTLEACIRRILATPPRGPRT